ncbi:MAG: NAD(+)/NADH kinase [Infirmifilum sp.]
MKVWLKSRSTDSGMLQWIKRIDEFLVNNNVEVLVDPVLGHVLKRDVLSESEAYNADLAVVVGGDGTLLRSVQKSNGRLPPIVGFTSNSVGYFLLHQVADYRNVLENVLVGRYMLNELRLGEYAIGNQHGVFLNEVSIWAHTGRLIEFEVTVDGEKLYHARADGVIVATPAGSTAHALSYGSPIILSQDIPLLEVVFAGALSPLIKPIIVYSRKIELQVMTWPAMMVVDGQSAFSLEYSSSVRLTPSEQILKLVAVQEYMRRLNDRLRQRLLDRGLSQIV